MIVKLIGNVNEILEDRIYLEVCNIVYEIFCPRSTLLNIDKNITICLYISHIFRDDGQLLYGFSKNEEKFWFLELIKINGLGPKFAINILSALSIADIYSAILSSDEKLFTKASGVGPKLASRIVNEMQNLIHKIQSPIDNSVLKLNKNNTTQNSNNALTESIDALITLGFQKSTIYTILAKKFAENNEITTADLIKFGLNNLGR